MFETNYYIRVFQSLYFVFKKKLLFRTPLNPFSNSENVRKHWFSDVFQWYQKGTLAWNLLMDNFVLLTFFCSSRASIRMYSFHYCTSLKLLEGISMFFISLFSIWLVSSSRLHWLPLKTKRFERFIILKQGKSLFYFFNNNWYRYFSISFSCFFSWLNIVKGDDLF